MHPKCFEVYKRASLQKSGQVDIDGLWLLRDVRMSRPHSRWFDADRERLGDEQARQRRNDKVRKTPGHHRYYRQYTRFVNFPEGRDVKTVTDQWYV